MKRHFIVTDQKESNSERSIYIDGKSRFLYSNKKRIKRKIFEIIKEKIPQTVDTPEKISIAYKTIKDYINQVRNR